MSRHSITRTVSAIFIAFGTGIALGGPSAQACTPHVDADGPTVYSNGDPNPVEAYSVDTRRMGVSVVTCL